MAAELRQSLARLGLQNLRQHELEIELVKFNPHVAGRGRTSSKCRRGSVIARSRDDIDGEGVRDGERRPTGRDGQIGRGDAYVDRAMEVRRRRAGD